jgi:hypothetical protein
MYPVPHFSIIFFSVLEAAQVQLPIITVQWFLCLFVNTLKPEVTLRCWDVFLNEGSKALFRIAEALFILNEQRIISTLTHGTNGSNGSSNASSHGTHTNAGELFKLLRDIGSAINDPDLLIATAYPSYRPSMTPLFSANPASASPSSSPLSRVSPTSAGSNYRIMSAKRSPRSAKSLAPTASPLSCANGVTGAVVGSGFGFGVSGSGLKSLPPELNGLGLAHLGPMSLLSKITGSGKALKLSKNGSVHNTLSGGNNDGNRALIVGAELTNSSAQTASAPAPTSTLTTTTSEILDPDAPQLNCTNVDVDASDGTVTADKEGTGSLYVPTEGPLEADMSNKSLRAISLTRRSRQSGSAISGSSEGVSSSNGQRFEDARATAAPSADILAQTSPMATLLSIFTSSSSNIKRADIQILRNKYRPELEGRFQMMEITRAQHKTDHYRQVSNASVGVAKANSLDTLARTAEFEDDESDNQTEEEGQSVYESTETETQDGTRSSMSDGGPEAGLELEHEAVAARNALIVEDDSL